MQTKIENLSSCLRIFLYLIKNKKQHRGVSVLDEIIEMLSVMACAQWPESHDSDRF
jgi:hypothetical protein